MALYPLNSKCGTRELDNFQPQGTPVGVSLAPGPDGKPGGSYQFTGNADSYIEFPNDGGLDVKHSFTLLCWVYPESSEGPLFHYGTDTERGKRQGDCVSGTMMIFYQNCAELRLITFACTQNVPTTPRRRYQVNSRWKSNP